MSNTIWKFELEITDIQSVIMPQSSRILSVDKQGSNLCLWALVDPQSPKFLRTIEIIGTGHPINPPTGVVKRQFLGTVVMSRFVWHIFEIE